MLSKSDINLVMRTGRHLFVKLVVWNDQICDLVVKGFIILETSQINVVL